MNIKLIFLAFFIATCVNLALSKPQNQELSNDEQKELVRVVRNIEGDENDEDENDDDDNSDDDDDDQDEGLQKKKPGGPKPKPKPKPKPNKCPKCPKQKLVPCKVRDGKKPSGDNHDEASEDDDEEDDKEGARNAVGIPGNGRKLKFCDEYRGKFDEADEEDASDSQGDEDDENENDDDNDDDE